MLRVKNTDNQKKKSSIQNDLVIVLDNLRSASNIGNIYRLAEALNIKAIYPCGYTAHPPHPKIAKTARNTELETPTHHFVTTSQACQKLKEQNYKLVAVETTSHSIDFWEFSFEIKTALIFGNEALGIEQQILQLCDAIVQLPLLGRKNSINVANCASALLFKAVRDIANESL